MALCEVVLTDSLQNNLAEVKHLKKILVEEEILVKIRYLLFSLLCLLSYFGCLLSDVFALF